MMALALRRLSSSRKKPIFSNGVSLRSMSSLPTSAMADSERSRSSWIKQLNAPLEEIDPEIADIIELEKARQWKGFELIPSENFTSASVMEAVGRSKCRSKHITMFDISNMAISFWTIKSYTCKTEINL
ncbi:hypothetical protein F2Q68_00046260 [Brassica cretica]|uniref:Serine hydroxymethyltransferase-like domain-containing protein n=1 Tax=Brassica cretica TaxID=69181 RepID=A0A8S9LVF4_BRACR|nr:hypothetical protein F2Q68_00046260 [Brassica cretica]